MNAADLKEKVREHYGAAVEREAAKRVFPGGSVIGVEMTAQMIAAARKNARSAGVDNVEFRAGDADNLPVADASIDHVISNCVVNLVPDKKKVFSDRFRWEAPELEGTDGVVWSLKVTARKPLARAA